MTLVTIKPHQHPLPLAGVSRPKQPRRHLHRPGVVPSIFPISIGEAAISMPHRIGSLRRCSSVSSFVAPSGSLAVVLERCPRYSPRMATKLSHPMSLIAGLALRVSISWPAAVSEKVAAAS